MIILKVTISGKKLQGWGEGVQIDSQPFKGQDSRIKLEKIQALYISSHVLLILSQYFISIPH